MKSTSPLLLIAAVGSLFPSFIYALGLVDDAGGDPFVIAGYLPDYRAYIDINATAMHLTDLMLFSLTPESVLKYASTKSSVGGCCLSSDLYDKIRKARSYKTLHQPSAKNIRLLLTVGGGGRSNGFREVVTGSSQTQRQFMEGLVQLCTDEELDGIDLDYEGVQSWAEWNAYLKFLTTASIYLHRHGILLTVALHPGQHLPALVCINVDRVHVMSYDMMHNKQTNHHASIHTVKDALTAFIQEGCPSSKLVMGIPAYGRHKNNPGLVKTYSEIVDGVIMQNSNDGKMKEIRKSIQSMQTWEGYIFDSPDNVREKVEYAIQNGFGGIFIWELGQDKQMADDDVAEGGVLLEAAASSASNNGFGYDASNDSHFKNEL